MRKEPDNKSSGTATANIACKTSAAASTFRQGNKDPYDSDTDTAYHFSNFVQDRREARIMRLKARLAKVCTLRAASAMEYCDHPQSSGMMPDFPDISSIQPTLTWTGGRDIPDCYFGLPADSHAAIDVGEPEETQAKNAVIQIRRLRGLAGRNVSPVSLRTRILHRLNSAWSRKRGWRAYLSRNLL